MADWLIFDAMYDGDMMHIEYEDEQWAQVHMISEGCYIFMDKYELIQNDEQVSENIIIKYLSHFEGDIVRIKHFKYSRYGCCIFYNKY